MVWPRNWDGERMKLRPPQLAASHFHAAVSNRDGTSNGTDHIAGRILDHNKGPVPGRPPVEWA
jgi:hypothetical protein